jgi:uncharacterized protein YjbI with pentapeptide repeats
MANGKQLAILNKGVDEWNKWRAENPLAEIDLTRAALYLNDFDIEWSSSDYPELDEILSTYIIGVDFRHVNFSNARITSANLDGANLCRSKLNFSDLRYSRFTKANFVQANLSGANLCAAELTGAQFYETNLENADLSGTTLKSVNFNRANLIGVKFENAEFSNTVIDNIDLGKANQLERTLHYGPSTIGSNTLKYSKGKIPIEFLRGCGLSDWEIESARLYNPELSASEINEILYRMYDLRATQAIQINPLFISYSHTDGKFVDAMEELLNKKGIRFWRDVHKATSGRLEKIIDLAIRQNPTMLLVLSENSVKSDWVEHEARKARELEKETGRDVLCPVALDDAWKDCRWPERLREQIMEYNIMDFSKWRDEEEFGRKFAKLVEGLDLFYKK